jgi:hypothetical protein
MTLVVVARFPNNPDPELLQVERLPRNEADVRKAVSIAAFLALAEIFDPTVPCMGAAQRDMAYPLLETEGLDLLREYASVEADSVADAVAYLTERSHKQTVAGQTTRRTLDYLHSRRNDGMNSRGDLSMDGLCYSDYTLYQAVNPPQSEIGSTTVSPANHVLLCLSRGATFSHSNYFTIVYTVLRDQSPGQVSTTASSYSRWRL